MRRAAMAKKRKLKVFVGPGNMQMQFRGPHNAITRKGYLFSSDAILPPGSNNKQFPFQSRKMHP